MTSARGVSLLFFLTACGSAETPDVGSDAPGGGTIEPQAQVCEIPATAFLADTTVAPDFARASLHYDDASGRCALVSGTTSPFSWELTPGPESEAGSYCQALAPEVGENPDEMPGSAEVLQTGLLEFTRDAAHGNSVFAFYPATYEFATQDQSSSSLLDQVTYRATVHRGARSYLVEFEFGTDQNVTVHLLTGI